MKEDYILFVSHSELNKELVDYFVKFLRNIGVKKQQIFYSSDSKYNVPLGCDIYDYLRTIIDKKVIPIFMLSDEYYESVACLNEMGAFWIKRLDYYTFLLPGFEFKKIKGAINPNKAGIKLDSDHKMLKGELTKFKDDICKLFEISPIDALDWEEWRDDFISQISKFSPSLKVDMNNSKTISIGSIDENISTECNREPYTGKTIAKFSFNKTEADICSLVFYLDALNLSKKYESKKSVNFNLRSKNIDKVAVEIQIGNDEIGKQSVQYWISPENDWQEYNIDLTLFGGSIKKWKCCREINFLIYRQNVLDENTPAVVEVKNIMFV